MSLLGENTDEKIFSHFLAYPDEIFYGAQVAELLDISAGAVHSALNNFHSLGLLEREEKGKTVLYSLNEKSPIVRPYKIIYSIKLILPLIKKLAPYAREVFLFGSSARGQYISESDIDLALICDSENEEKIEGIVAHHNIKRRIQLQLMSVVEFAKLEANDPDFYLEITRGINLFNRNQDEPQLQEMS